MGRLLYILMVIGGIGMIFGMIKEKQGYPWARPLTIVCVLITIALAALTMLPNGSMQRAGRRYRAIREQYQEVVGQVVGQYVAENFEGKRIAVVTATDGPNHYLTGMKRVGNGNLQFERFTLDMELIRQEWHDWMLEDEMPPGGEMEYIRDTLEDMTVDEMELPISIDVIDQALQLAAQDADLVICALSLPFGQEQMRFWRQRETPLLLLQGAELGNIDDLVSRMRRNQLAAMVMFNPEADFQLDSIPSDPQEAFDSRYVLITPDNLQQMIREHPDMFGIY